MDVLKRYIRSLLREAAYGPDDMQDDMYVMIKGMGSDYAVVNLMSSGAAGAMGSVGIQRPDGLSGPCDGAWVISTTNATHGWGPMLYDIAMEWATMHGGKGLTPDRDSVSPDARRVWKYYLQSRQDVSNSQLDDMDNTLTTIDRDNCQQDAAAEIRDGGDWQKSPLSKRYTKEPTTIQRLKSMGRLRVQ